MSDYEQAVFISYARDGKQEDIVNQIDQSLQKRGLKIFRDKRDLGYRGSIKKFMERIGRGNCVIVVISDKYLRDSNGMFELVEIAEGKQFHDRIFPIILADAEIYDPVKRLAYVSHWEAKRAELAAALKDVDPANLQGIREDMDSYDRIRDKVSSLTSILKDMNIFTAEIHHDTDFSHIYESIVKRMEEAKSASSTTRTREIKDLNAPVRAKKTKETNISEQPRTVSGTIFPGDKPRMIQMSQLEKLGSHQSTLKNCVEGYLMSSERWAECGNAKSILVERGTNRFYIGEILSGSDWETIRSSINASAAKVLPDELMSGDLKVLAEKYTVYLEKAQQAVQKGARLKADSSQKIETTLQDAMRHINDAINGVKQIMHICAQSATKEIVRIESLIETIVGTEESQEPPKAIEIRTATELKPITNNSIETHQTFPIQR